MRKSSWIVPPATLAAVACFVGSHAACVSIPADSQQPQLATHVQDWRDEVIYQLIVDRFADGDVNNDPTVQPGSLAKYQGGDWKGIEDHLDYLQALGVTTMWISPIIKNVDSDADIDGYHGYWAQDLTQLNPHFGDLASLRSMVAHAHDRGMKVVLDIVCNHMGQLFFYDINKNGQPDVYVFGSGSPTDPLTQVSEFAPDFDPNGVQSYSAAGGSGRAPIIFIHNPSIDRVPPAGILGTATAYHGMGQILDYNIEEQRTLGDFPGGLKDVATELPEVRTEMINDFGRWVDLVDLDGFRIDTVKHVDHGFWQTFAPGIRTHLAGEGKNNFLMFGESFDGDDVLDGSYTVPNEMDSVFYFAQHFTVFEQTFAYAHDPALVASAQQNAGWHGTKSIEDLWNARATNWSSTPQPGGVGLAPNKIPVNFIDNHDVPRFLYEAAGDTDALKNALTLQMTEEGIPCVYYGTEQGFNGGNDPANREVLWNTNFATDGDIFTHIAKVTRIRQAYIALRRGDTNVVWSTTDAGTEEDAGIFAYERAGGDAGSSYALVVLNTNEQNMASSTSSGSMVMKVSAAPGTSLVDVLNPGMAAYTVASDGTMKLSVGKQSGMILIPSTQVVSM